MDMVLQLSPAGRLREYAQISGNWSQDSSTFAEMEQLQAITGHPWLLRHLSCRVWRNLYISVDQQFVMVRCSMTMVAEFDHVHVALFARR